MRRTSEIQPRRYPRAVSGLHLGDARAWPSEPNPQLRHRKVRRPPGRRGQRQSLDGIRRPDLYRRSVQAARETSAARARDDARRRAPCYCRRVARRGGSGARARVQLRQLRLSMRAGPGLVRRRTGRIACRRTAPAPEPTLRFNYVLVLNATLALKLDFDRPAS